MTSGFRLTRLLLLTSCAVVSFAAPSLTTVRDTLVLANGGAFDGVLQIEWKSFRAADGTEIPQNSITVTISGGSLIVRLVPTTNALRPAYYTVKYNADGRTQFVEYWSVPPSTAPLRVRDVRTGSPGGGPIAAPLTQIAVQDVSGLRTELDLRPARGATWMTRRAVTIGDTGSLEAVLGSPGDCVRVDGTSGPCGTGNAASGTQYIDNEIPSGAIDGVNTVFRLSAAPFPAGSLALYRDGALQRQGTSYTLSGLTITLAGGTAPRAGDLLTASYRIDPAGALGVLHADLEIPSGVVNGVNTEFTLSGVPVPAASLHVFRNGLLQRLGVDYTIAVDRISFRPASVPQQGDLLQATYRK